MGLVIKIAATLLILIGVIWFLQGVNMLTGSSMTGDRKWALIGGGCVIVGIAAWLYVASRRRRPPPSP